MALFDILNDREGVLEEFSKRDKNMNKYILTLSFLLIGSLLHTSDRSYQTFTDEDLAALEALKDKIVAEDYNMKPADRIQYISTRGTNWGPQWGPSYSSSEIQRLVDQRARIVKAGGKPELRRDGDVFYFNWSDPKVQSRLTGSEFEKEIVQKLEELENAFKHYEYQWGPDSGPGWIFLSDSASSRSNRDWEREEYEREKAEQKRLMAAEKAAYRAQKSQERMQKRQERQALQPIAVYQAPVSEDDRQSELMKKINDYWG